MAFDETMKIRLSSAQKLRLVAKGEKHPEGMSGAIRDWIDSTDDSNVVLVEKVAEKRPIAVSSGGSKFSAAELQAMADRVKARTSEKKSRDSQAS